LKKKKLLISIKRWDRCRNSWRR